MTPPATPDELSPIEASGDSIRRDPDGDDGRVEDEPKQGGSLGALSGHTLIYILGNLFPKVASILLLKEFTKPDNLTLADYGILGVLSPTILLGLQLLGMQLDAAMGRHYFESDDPDYRKRVVSTAYGGVLGLTLLVTIPLWFSSEWLAVHWLERPDLPYIMRAVAVFLAGMVLTEIPLAALRVERRSLAVSSWQLVRVICEVSLKIVFVVGLSMGVMGVMTGQAIVAAAFLVGFGGWLVKRYGARFDVTIFRSMLAFSAPMIVASLCQFALHNADRFMLKGLSTDDEIGLYDVAYQFGYAVNAVVLGAFLLIWYPLVFSIRDEREQRELIGSASLHVPALILLLSLPIALLAPEIVSFFTSNSDFFPAWEFIPIVLLSYVFWGHFQMTQTPFYIHKQTGRLPLVVGTAALMNLGINWLLIPTYGAYGAAFATLLALAALAALTYVTARRLEPVPFPWRRSLHLVGVTVVAAIVLYGIPTDNGAVWLAMRVAVWVGGTVWLLGPFLRPEERAQMVSLVRNKLGRRAAK